MDTPAVPSTVEATRWAAVASVFGLIALSLAWELWLAPTRIAPIAAALKALPLCVPIAGLLKRRMYTYRWVSLLVWLYFMDGVVRATDGGATRVLAGIEIALAVVLFASCAAHVRLRLSHHP